MRKTALFVLLVLVAAFFGQCERNFGPLSGGSGEQPSPLQKQIVQSGNRFTFRLLQQLNSRLPGQNLFFSPLSISFALGMTLNGAADSTLAGMQKTLGLEGLSLEDINRNYRDLMLSLMQADPAVQMEIANSIWYDRSLQVNPDFLRINRTYFFAEVSPLNFFDPGAVNVINAWVNEKTHGKIPQIIGQLHPGTDVMVLLNAIYFLGSWTYAFDEQGTTGGVFYPAEGDTQHCRMMNQLNEFAYLQGADFQAVDLPYGAGRYHMAVLLPAPEVDVGAFAAALTAEKWNQIRSQMMQESAVQKVALFLPKFKLRCSLREELKQSLGAMGMARAFEAGRADFSRLSSSEGKNLFISDILHKAFVQVSEQGTEAAGATAVIVSRTSVGGPSYPMVVVDRPFLFLIWEQQTGAVLFAGKVLRLEK